MSRPPVPRSDAVARAAAVLHGERAALSRLGPEIEGDFVRLGELLGETSSASSKLSAVAGELRRIARNEDEDRALIFSFQLFKKFADLVEAGLERAERVRSGLGVVSAEVLELGKREEDFSEVVTMFWLLKTSFRVEAAGLSREHGAALGALTDGMEEIHGGLKELISVQFGRLAATRLRVGRLEGKLGEIQSKSRARLREARGEIEADMERFTAALAPAAEHGERVVVAAERAAVQVSQVIVSLQFHDIVRQRLEHVAAAISGILRAVEPQAGGDAAATDAATAHFSARIQLEQVRDARVELARAGDAIVTGIRGVLECGDALLVAGQELQRLVAEGLRRSQASTSFVQRIQELHESGGAVTRDVSSLVALAAEVGGIVEDLSVEVVRKTRALRLVALNAGVHSSRVAGGGTLEQLAAITQRNADDALRHTNALLGKARAILDGVQALRGIVESFVTLSASEDEVLEQEATTAARYLAEMRGQVMAGLRGVDADFERLRPNAQRVLRGLGFQSLIAARFDRTESALEAMVEATASASELAGEDYEERLEGLRRQYTMDREREMHDAVLRPGRGGAQEASVGPAPPAGSTSDGAGDPTLGDNVELF